MLDGADSINSSVEVDAEPFALRSARKLDFKIFKHMMNAIISERIIFIIDGNLGVQKFKGNARRIGAFFNVFNRGLIECLTFGGKFFSAVVIVVSPIFKSPLCVSAAIPKT